jgi:hypothetical protein
VITLDPEFRALIPRLAKEERAQLEANIIADGCRDPLVTWGGILVDGHNRYEICTANSIVFDTRNIEFASRDDAKAWIIRNQFGRRNLTNFQRAELALLLEPLIAKKAKENQIAGGGDQKSGHQKSDKPIRPVETIKEIAKIAGVSHDTIHKAKIVSAEANEETKAQLRAGDKTINAAYRELRPEPKPSKPPALRGHSVKPDFSIVSPRAVKPTITPQRSSFPVPVNLPRDPAKAAVSLFTVFDNDFMRQLAAEIMEILNGDSAVG